MIRADRFQALLDLIELLSSIDSSVDAIIVEGSRDREALRRLGFDGVIEMHSMKGFSEEELVEEIGSKYKSVLLLTDFDEEGRQLNKRLTRIFERRGVKVDLGLRRVIGRLMATLGVYSVEDLENIRLRIGSAI
ncbi:toprim domain-containing protein [Candidatus Bathyarchaeota archaeon]|nr:toprim domain-containing protein [Candidatus Bathyarchaeota archaeon]MBS7630678.1 toprim domain-containing protein [Candidatus Bathyarchaeota archaeon]